MRKLLLILAIAVPTILSAQLRIISYNVENLFNTTHDTLKLDEDYTPDGKFHWNYSRYQRKIENLSRVLVNIGNWDNAAIIGLCEVENQECLDDLLQKGGLRKFGYKYIHQESPDQRGIDCALLYDPQQFKLQGYQFISVPMPKGERPTRDIVYAKGIVRMEVRMGNGRERSRRSASDTLHIMMCHLPSQLGGTEQTAHKRAVAHRVLQATVDSLLSVNPRANIVIMGDMNSVPTDRLHGMHNLMMPLERQGLGTHKWEGVWSCLDQFYVSDALFQYSTPNIYSEDWIMEEDRKHGGQQPMRCYKYTSWQPGYSDHLPIFLDIR